ncbi:MAG: glutamate-5-semialdehyde dehydrogenase [Deltaproteobacteria bacterium]|nr:glutamate-5-semialdehyde dehydrogenase [Deltaproteobacteria bacterium]
MELIAKIQTIAQQAKESTAQLVRLITPQKNNIISAWAVALAEHRNTIKEVNAGDVRRAGELGYAKALIDRLTLSDKVIDGMIKGLQEVVALNDPIGEVIESAVRPNGLIIEKLRVAIGVVAIIYESRPNVTVDAASLCFKTSNAVILRGGKESLATNICLVDILQKSGAAHGLPANAVQLIATPEHEAVNILIKQSDYLDLVIPRGGEKLIRAVTENSYVPVIKHYKGNCHIYVEGSAAYEEVERIIVNAKCQRPGVCNAVEKIIFNQNAAQYLPRIAQALAAKGVRVKADQYGQDLYPQAELASENDWYEEYLDLIIAFKMVNSVAEAIAHINKYGSHHSDAILTKDENSIGKFFQEVDSAVVYANASTRFTDGNEFGLGAEIGISTDKIQARGPMGLKELTTYKYQVRGEGQVRS